MKRFIALAITVIVILSINTQAQKMPVKFKDIKKNFQGYWGKNKVQIVEESVIYPLVLLKAGENYFVVSYSTSEKMSEADQMTTMQFQLWLLDKYQFPNGANVNLMGTGSKETKFWHEGRNCNALSIYAISDRILVNKEKLDMAKVIPN